MGQSARARGDIKTYRNAHRCSDRTPAADGLPAAVRARLRRWGVSAPFALSLSSRLPSLSTFSLLLIRRC